MAKEKIVRKKMKRKKKSKIYFGMECQNAIVEFNGLPKEPKYDIQRQKIYQDRIHAPFDKLVENIIHTFKFYYFDVSSEDVKNEVVSNLYMNMGKYDPDKGRAFSYFSVMAKNYLIHNNNKNYKMYKTHDEIGELDFKRDVANESSRQDTKEFNRDFMDSLINYWDNNIFTIFRRSKDIRVADAVLHLMKTRDNIENFNKKVLYILIREMSGSNTQHITRVINVMKHKNVGIKTDYLNRGFSTTQNTGSIFF